MGKEDDGYIKGPQITVPVPLNEYLDLLSAQEALNKPVYTRAQAAEENLEKESARIKKKLISFYKPETRGRKRTENSCAVLSMDILVAAVRFEKYHHSSSEIHPRRVFAPCLDHYRYFYDVVAKQKMEEKNEEFKRRILEASKLSAFSGIDTSDLYPLSDMQEPPYLINYQNRLHWKLQPLLPFYIAAYFIPKPDLYFPEEIEEALN